jgi:hypothetical protein
MRQRGQPTQPRPPDARLDAELRRMLARLREGRDVRSRMIGRIRSAIRGGTYTNDLKLAVAVQRMLDEESEG